MNYFAEVEVNLQASPGATKARCGTASSFLYSPLQSLNKPGRVFLVF